MLLNDQIQDINVCILLGISPASVKIVVCRRFGTLYQFRLQRLDVRYEVWLLRSGRGILL